jgi:itaconate CoA-transferase
MSKPLSGLLVVALEQAVAAPYCTSRLADAGARVIKLERPEGDFARGYDDVAAGSSSYFVWLNRGKESVFCDLAREEDRRLFEALLAEADVFVQNLKPGALAKLGFAPDALRRRFPRLICCSISGFAEGGEWEKRKAYDLLIQAEAGLAAVTGGPEAPARVGVSIVDIATGASALQAILEQLYAREKTGQGADIRVSMFDVTADWMAVPFLHAAAGKPPKRIGLAHPSISPYGVFQTCDGRPLLISIQNEREWVLLCDRVLDDPEFARDPMFASNVERVRNRPKTDARVAAHFARLDSAELSRRLNAADIAFAFVNEVTDLLEHPELTTMEISTEGGPVSTPAPGARIDGQRRSPGSVPALGAQDAAVRKEFLGGG